VVDPRLNFFGAWEAWRRGVQKVQKFATKLAKYSVKQRESTEFTPSSLDQPM